MKYDQIPLSRLSRAAVSIERRLGWHPFHSDERTHYRVVGRMVQRVRLEQGEDERCLELFEHIPPLPRRLFHEGFREGISFRVDDDAYVLHGMYLRLFVGWDLLARAGEAFGVRTHFAGENSLEYSVVVGKWSLGSVLEALATARAFALVAADLAHDARDGIPHTVGEIRGLIRTAREVLLEDSASERPGTASRAEGKGDQRWHAEQTSLFPEGTE
ncbi:MAG: hypothetical protein QHI48_07545 [Bacteroidota bacterium]|nr:hypothetical protein [Bacteroidota bacterium]